MIKVTFCLRKRPDLTAEEFHDYWLNQHGPIVSRHAETLKIRKYVQQHTLDTPMNALLRESRGGPEAFDGVAEVWFNDMATLEAAMSDEAGREGFAALLEDEKNFIDLARSPLWITEEHEILG